MAWIVVFSDDGDDNDDAGTVRSRAVGQVEGTGRRRDAQVRGPTSDRSGSSAERTTSSARSRRRPRLSSTVRERSSRTAVETGLEEQCRIPDASRCRQTDLQDRIESLRSFQNTQTRVQTDSEVCPYMRIWLK